ncbi:MAG: hypothetical protein HYY99_01585 [Candidatus Colwellbacteria bacterium]|nr:hypothetical protein [Candidatus Colwellbacteria bacterium]MBI3088928.1 hypothetical protein [Candidatus Colwellbacteria bacterium]
MDYGEMQDLLQKYEAAGQSRYFVTVLGAREQGDFVEVVLEGVVALAKIRECDHKSRLMKVCCVEGWELELPFEYPCRVLETSGRQ